MQYGRGSVSYRSSELERYRTTWRNETIVAFSYSTTKCNWIVTYQIWIDCLRRSHVHFSTALSYTDTVSISACRFYLQIVSFISYHSYISLIFLYTYAEYKLNWECWRSQKVSTKLYKLVKSVHELYCNGYRLWMLVSCSIILNRYASTYMFAEYLHLADCIDSHCQL